VVFGKNLRASCRRGAPRIVTAEAKVAMIVNHMACGFASKLTILRFRLSPVLLQSRVATVIIEHQRALLTRSTLPASL
jgi:hypothetical protein